MSKGSNNECSICLENLDLSALASNLNNIYTLDCNHSFHKNCITKWLETKLTCPLCRAPIKPLKRYIDDKIITAERLTSIFLFFSSFIETVSQNSNFEGLTEHMDEFLSTPEMQMLVNETIESFSNIENNQNAWCSLF